MCRANARCPVICEGPKFRILAVRLPDGTCPAMEFIASLNPADRAKVDALLRRTAEHGPPQSEEKFKRVEPDIYAFKSFQIRIPCFYGGKGIIFLSHGFKKKQDKWPPAQVKRAKDIRKEHEVLS